MHRMIEISVPPEITQRIRPHLLGNPKVISITLLKKASLKPLGDDVLQIHVLNKGADEVLSLVHRYCGERNFSVVTSEVASITDPASEQEINHDVDEAIWEEVETGLRHNGRITPNFLMLMALGGAIAAIGFVGDVQMQVIAFISASIIAPGLEPIAKLALGLALRKKEVLWEGFKATTIGYSLLMLAAAGTFAILLGTGSTHPKDLLNDSLAIGLRDVTLKDAMTSVFASAASMIMYLSYRRNVIAGPLIALVTIPAAAGAAMHLVLGTWPVARLLLTRTGVDILLIILVGVAVILVKQRFVHKRRPLL